MKSSPACRLYHAAFFQALQPCEHGVGADAHFPALSESLLPREVAAEGGEEGVAVGVAAAAHFGRGEERQYMGGMAVERFYEAHHGVEVLGGYGYVPAADDAVLEVVAGGVLVRGHKGGAAHRPEHGHYRQHAARIDGQAGHRAVHFAAVGYAGAREERGEQPVELSALPLVEPHVVHSAGLKPVDAPLPLPADGRKGRLKVGVVGVELVLPLPNGRHVIEQLSREESVLGRRYERLNLGGSAREQHGEVRLLHFAVFAVGAPVVRQAVVVEGLSERVAPVAVVGAYGRGDGVGLALADYALAVGVDKVLQYARAGVVAGYYEHAVPRLLRRLLPGALLAHKVVGGLCLAVFVVLGLYAAAYVVVYGFGYEPRQREGALAARRRRHHERLQARRQQPSAVGAPYVAAHARPEHRQSAKQQGVALRRRSAVGRYVGQGPRPVMAAQRWQRRYRLAALGGLLVVAAATV